MGVRPRFPLLADHLSRRTDLQRDVVLQRLNLGIAEVSKQLELTQMRVERAASIFRFHRGLMVRIPPELVENIAVELQQLTIHASNDGGGSRRIRDATHLAKQIAFQQRRFTRHVIDISRSIHGNGGDFGSRSFRRGGEPAFEQTRRSRLDRRGDNQRRQNMPVAFGIDHGISGWRLPLLQRIQPDHVLGRRNVEGRPSRLTLLKHNFPALVTPPHNRPRQFLDGNRLLHPPKQAELRQHTGTDGLVARTNIQMDLAPDGL